jgi:hypothetical protein
MGIAVMIFKKQPEAIRLKTQQASKTIGEDRFSIRLIASPPLI